MKRFPSIVTLPAIGLLLMAGIAGAADVTLVGGNVSMTISTAVAGQQPSDASNENCLLQWTTLVSDPLQKITIQTSLVSPQFTLHAQPNDVVHGAEVDRITLQTTAQDFVTSIPPDVTVSSPGSCTIEYTAAAQAANGTGTDSHTITFTIVGQ